MLIHHLIWIRTGSGDCSDHLGWIWTGSGGYGDLIIRKKETNISVNANLLTVKQVQSSCGSVVEHWFSSAIGCGFNSSGGGNKLHLLTLL